MWTNTFVSSVVNYKIDGNSVRWRLIVDHRHDSVTCPQRLPGGLQPWFMILQIAFPKADNKYDRATVRLANSQLKESHMSLISTAASWPFCCLPWPIILMGERFNLHESDSVFCNHEISERIRVFGVREEIRDENVAQT